MLCKKKDEKKHTKAICEDSVVMLSPNWCCFLVYKISHLCSIYSTVINTTVEQNWAESIFSWIDITTKMITSVSINTHNCWGGKKRQETKNIKRGKVAKIGNEFVDILKKSEELKQGFCFIQCFDDNKVGYCINIINSHMGGRWFFVFFFCCFFFLLCFWLSVIGNRQMVLILIRICF